MSIALRALLALGLGALTLSCGESEQVAAPIVVRLLADLSGPNHHVSAVYNAGRVDLLQELSGSPELGGREIQYEVADTGGDVDEAFRAYLNWKGQLA